MCGHRKCDALIVAALCAMCMLKAAANGQAEPTIPATGDVQKPTLAPTTTTQRDDDIVGNADLLKQVLAKKCLHRYTMTCMKLDMVRLIDRLGTSRAYQLVPGVSLVRAVDGNNHTTTTGHQNHHHHQQQQQHNGNSIPLDVVRSLVRGNESAEELDGYLMEKVDTYLNSLSISVKLVDSAVIENVRKLSSHMLINMLPTGLLETTGRGKKNGMQMALWSAGTLAAIGFASLAAMSGKALMTAMLALALAAICALRGQGGGGGGNGKTSHYEIITKPAIYEHDHLVHGAAYSSAPYNYARHLSMDGSTYHVGGRGHSPPMHVGRIIATTATAVDSPSPDQQSLVATPARGDNDDDDEGNVSPPPYPLSPVAYMPTNDA